MAAPTPTAFDTPPHSLEAEKTVLGALLLDPEAIIKISDFLKPEDFYDPTHRIIYLLHEQARSRERGEAGANALAR